MGRGWRRGKTHYLSNSFWRWIVIGVAALVSRNPLLMDLYILSVDYGILKIIIYNLIIAFFFKHWLIVYLFFLRSKDWNKKNPFQTMGTPNKDIVIKDDAPSELLLDKHMNFLVSYSERKNDYEYVVTGKEA